MQRWLAGWTTIRKNATGCINGNGYFSTNTSLGTFGWECGKSVFTGDELIAIVPDKYVETVLVTEISISICKRKGNLDGICIETILYHLIIIHRNKLDDWFDGEVWP